MFTRIALAAAPFDSLGREQTASIARRKSPCPSWPPESFARRALSTHPQVTDVSIKGHASAGARG